MIKPDTCPPRIESRRGGWAALLPLSRAAVPSGRDYVDTRRLEQPHQRRKRMPDPQASLFTQHLERGKH